MFESFHDFPDFAQELDLSPDYLDPFHSQYQKLTPEQREQAARYFAQAVEDVSTRFNPYDEAGNIKGETEWQKHCREKFVKILHELAKPEFAQHLNFLATTLQSMVEIELQEGPLWSKLAQHAHYLGYLGECVIVARDLKGVLELEYKIWRSENEQEFVKSAFQVQIDGAPVGPDGKKLTPTASALKISDDRINSAMLRDPQKRKIAVDFEEQLSYINSIESKARNMYHAISCAAKSNGLISKLMGNTKYTGN